MTQSGSPEEFAEIVFNLACSLHGNPATIAKGVRSRDALVRRQAIEEAAEVGREGWHDGEECAKAILALADDGDGAQPPQERA